MKGVFDMATSSITKNFVVSGEKQVEICGNAIEESYQESLRTAKDTSAVKYRELKDDDELNIFMKKWKEVHG